MNDAAASDWSRDFGFVVDGGGRRSSLDDLCGLIDWVPIEDRLAVISCAAKGETSARVEMVSFFSDQLCQTCCCSHGERPSKGSMAAIQKHALDFASPNDRLAIWGHWP